MRKVFSLLFCSGLLFCLNFESKGMISKQTMGINKNVDPAVLKDLTTLENANAQLRKKILELEAKQNNGTLAYKDIGNLKKYRIQLSQNEKRINELNARVEKDRQRFAKEDENWKIQREQRSIEDLQRENASLIEQIRSIVSKGNYATANDIKRAQGFKAIVESNKVKIAQKRSQAGYNQGLFELSNWLDQQQSQNTEEFSGDLLELGLDSEPKNQDTMFFSDSFEEEKYAPKNPKKPKFKMD